MHIKMEVADRCQLCEEFAKGALDLKIRQGSPHHKGKKSVERICATRDLGIGY